MKTIRNEPFLHALYFGAILLIFFGYFFNFGSKDNAQQSRSLFKNRYWRAAHHFHPQDEKIPLWKRPEKLFHWQSVHFSEPFLWENFAQNQTNTECTNGSDIFGIWFLGKWCSTSRICPGKWVSDTQALRQVEQHRKDRRTEIRMCRKESGFRSSTSPSSRLPCGRTGQSSSRGARSRHRRRARFPWWAWLSRSCRGR